MYVGVWPVKAACVLCVLLRCCCCGMGICKGFLPTSFFLVGRLQLRLYAGLPASALVWC